MILDDFRWWFERRIHQEHGIFWLILGHEYGMIGPWLAVSENGLSTPVDVHFRDFLNRKNGDSSVDGRGYHPCFPDWKECSSMGKLQARRLGECSAISLQFIPPSGRQRWRLWMVFQNLHLQVIFHGTICHDWLPRDKPGRSIEARCCICQSKLLEGCQDMTRFVLKSVILYHPFQ